MSPRSRKPGGEANKPEKESDPEKDIAPVDTESVTGEDAAADVEETTDAAESEDVEGTDDADAGSADDEAEDDKDEADASDGKEESDEADDADEEDEEDEEDYPEDEDVEPAKPKRVISVSRIVAFGVLPAVVLLLAGAGAYFKWQSSSLRASQTSSIESLTAAKDGTVAMLSYKPESVEKDLGAARDRLTGVFKDSYIQLTHDVVIPGAKQRHISATATIPAAASVSATASHAVALVFVNQTVVVGNEPPSASASSVRVTMDKIGQRWLISGFDPV
jgi:Mce-associated membrane protein